MLSNTTKRILSALVLLASVSISIYYGKKSLMVFMLIFGAIAVDEIFCNIFKKNRISLFYFIAQAIFFIPFCYFNFLDFTPDMHYAIVNLGLVLNALLFVYLFYLPIESKTFEDISKSMPFLGGVLVVLPMISIANILHYGEWRMFIFILGGVNFGMDTGAWFFGKKYGKHKLWEKVSPKKTIEGLLGGMFTSGILGTLLWNLLIGRPKPYLFLLFCLLGVLSQIGDLIQSKIKRQFKIKDSSSLIPGHGGVYDRIDSLLYTAPFFSVVLKYYYY